MNGCKEGDVSQICVQCLKRICTERAAVKTNSILVAKNSRIPMNNAIVMDTSQAIAIVNRMKPVAVVNWGGWVSIALCAVNERNHAKSTIVTHPFLY